MKLLKISLLEALTLANSLLPAQIRLPGLPTNEVLQREYYPSPIANGGIWSEAFRLASDAVSQMTVEEKVNLTSAISGPCPSNSGGVLRLGIPGMCFDDGPSGPRYMDFVTQFPSAFSAAASFDKALIEERARAIGEEFRGKGINVALAPVTSGPLGRSPFAGRNWEAISPDPYLSSTLSFITVKGMQASGLITCAKHYILYEQEPVCTGPIVNGGRTECKDVSSEVDDKTMKELYLPSFAETVRAGTGAVMCSYNLINGTQSCENDQSMNRILKEELGFQGFILSDYGATHSTTPSAMSGMDMELPSVEYYGDHLLNAIREGEIPKARLDDMARRILTPWYAQKQHLSYPKTNWQKFDLKDESEQDGRVFRNEHVDVKRNHHLLARRIAAESTVLLKNNGVLPLKKIKSIGIFGSDADYPHTLTGCGPDLFCLVASEKRYWNGTVTIGGGSGAAYADYVVPPIEAITQRARQENIRTDYILHDDSSHFQNIGHVASQSDVCLVFVSLFLVEGWDREHLKLDKGGEELIKHVEGECKGEVVVVMHIGGQVVMEDWVDLPKIGAVLFAGYPGQESGNALVEVLWGDINPSGKLPFTMGKAVSDWPSGNIVRQQERTWYGEKIVPRAVFSEGLAIDYKWFDKYNIKPRYEFGFGLSYTTFEMSNLEIREEHRKDRDTVQPTNEKHEGKVVLYDTLVVIKVTVRNTGKVAGSEVVQLYMSFPPDQVDQPPKHLRGYEKVYLEPGQTSRVEMQLRKKDLAIWDVVKQLWRIPEGEFTFRIGNSSRKLPLERRLSIKSSK